MNFERRYFNSTDMSFRAIQDDTTGKKYIEGMASVFNVRSKLILENGELFYEEINSGAFTEVLQREGLDVIFTFNHSKDSVIARTVSGTLKLSENDDGLSFRAEIESEISDSSDLWYRVQRGDIFSNSFAFRVMEGDYRWLPGGDDGIPIRVIDRIADLRDVSSVTYAAYPETSVTARELADVVKPEEVEEEESQEDKPNPEREKLMMKIKIIQIENKL